MKDWDRTDDEDDGNRKTDDAGYRWVSRNIGGDIGGEYLI